MHVAVVIPCYNVARHIEDVVRSVPSIVQSIVLVDDKSTDDTLAVLEQIDDPRVVVRRHAVNQGVGGAVWSGYVCATELGADICVKMDGDGQMDGAALPALIQPLLEGTADYTKGNRFWDNRALSSMPFTRLMGNGVLSLLTKAVSGYWSIFDPTNGYTAVRTHVLRLINPSWIRPRYFFETSMLVALNAAGAVVRDVHMSARYGDEKSSLSIVSVLFQFPPLLVQSFLRRFLWRYVIRDFTALTVCAVSGAIAITFGATFGGYHWWKSIVTGVTATAGETILAALPILLGFQLIMVAIVLDTLLEPRVPVGMNGERFKGTLAPLRGSEIHPPTESVDAPGPVRQTQ